MISKGCEGLVDVAGRARPVPRHTTMALRASLALALPLLAFAADPSEGWLSYAVFKCVLYDHAAAQAVWPARAAALLPAAPGPLC